jgi:chorismate-pyruvate lyase
MIDASMTNTLEQDEGKNNVETIEKMFSSAIKYIEKMRNIKKMLKEIERTLRKFQDA